MINLQAVNRLAALLPPGSTIRVERQGGLFGELEFAMLTDEERASRLDWPPEPREGEVMVGWGLDERGVPVAVFLREGLPK